MTDAPAAVEQESWSVALSGGGHRAALFGLGALLYLAESGCNAQVTSIASVSGGSMTNGVLAEGVDFSTATVETVREKSLKLVRCCAHTGSVQWRAGAVAAAALAVLGALSLLAGLVLAIVQFAGAGIHLAALATGLGVGGLVVAGVASQSFSWLADRIFRAQLFGDTRLGDLADNARAGSTTHVFCTTELQSGHHLYLSPTFAYSYSYGLSTTNAKDLRLSTAVQASACFPPVFPPRRLSVRKLGFPTRSSWSFWLTDGGVYDNMGDQWARGFWESATKHQAFVQMGTAPGRLLGVNASTGSSPKRANAFSRVPLIGVLLSLVAESNVMYQETTATRRFDLVAQFDLVRQLEHLKDAESAPELTEAAVARMQQDRPLDVRIPMGGTLSHIATAATWPLHSRTPPPGCDAARFADIRAKLAAWGRTEQIESARDTAEKVGTTLGAVGSDAAVALLWHGYLLTMVNFAVFGYGTWCPQERSVFEALVERARTAG